MAAEIAGSQTLKAVLEGGILPLQRNILSTPRDNRFT